MRQFTDYGLHCSVNGEKGWAQLGFDTKTCYWSGHVYPKGETGEHYSSRSYAKTCEWFTEHLKKWDIK